ncbi:5,6-dimethylbenzimidazole synthase [Pseudovibrio sp. SPO723]|uniref:5,6-dimethylbenzimidazole synthase n=1 Tax=Nesiotobacter zosterae TaxID=392721 RepID=UPI0029C3EED0|nr:5,6-dimethylbenzimidazole synthase [Pseudovibrio sp. SPO723]MDX5593900.1 5,6-dimethylbenzimidazole synthase [Pseudovibrio sp. SPO723]
MTSLSSEDIPSFSGAFENQFELLLKWRRDVRHFLPDPVSRDDLDHLLQVADLAPSVGNSQPWRFVVVETPEVRSAVYESFKKANGEALAGYKGDKAKTYATLKLSGIEIAPVQLAVFCEQDPVQGAGLGRQTMPETLNYSVVSAIYNLWLAARIRGIGVGWVSILDPQAITKAMGAPDSWCLVAYLCIGYPVQETDTPELETLGWQKRTSLETRIFSDKELRRKD